MGSFTVILKVLVGSGVSPDGEGFARRLVALWTWLPRGQMAVDHVKKSFEQPPCRASAAELLIPFLLSPSFLLFQLCTDVNADWQCGSLHSPRLLSLAPSSSLPARPSYHVFLKAAATCAITFSSGLSITFPVQLFIFCLIVEASSCANIFHLQFMFGAKRISWSRGLMLICIFLFKKTSLCLEIPLKCLNESKEICVRSVFSSFPSSRYLCHGRAWQHWQAKTRKPVGHL